MPNSRYKILTKEEIDAGVAVDKYYIEITAKREVARQVVKDYQKEINKARLGVKRMEKRMRHLRFAVANRTAQLKYIKGDIIHRMTWQKIKQTRINLGLL